MQKAPAAFPLRGFVDMRWLAGKDQWPLLLLPPTMRLVLPPTMLAPLLPMMPVPFVLIIPLPLLYTFPGFDEEAAGTLGVDAAPRKWGNCGPLLLSQAAQPHSS